ncbi:hypothetical protein D3C78_1889790 [compost metagenome]
MVFDDMVRKEGSVPNPLVLVMIHCPMEPVALAVIMPVLLLPGGKYRVLNRKDEAAAGS